MKQSILDRSINALSPQRVLLGIGALAAVQLLRSANEYTFTDKVALITGGTRGLGLTLARELARQGAKVAICARDEDELRSAERDLRTIEPHLEVYTTRSDITVQTDAERTIHEIVQHFGRIDILVNNAGLIVVGPLSTMGIEEYQKLMAVHFWGPLYLMQAALPYMRRQGGGRIANISSIGGRVSVPHLSAYSASKFALTGLSDAMRHELRKDDILVTTVCPGLMRTGSHVNALVKGQHEAEYSLFRLTQAFPPFSMKVERAAHQILEAVRHGRPEITVGIAAQLLDKAHGIAPSLTAHVLDLVSSLLPTDGRRRDSKEGRSITLPRAVERLTQHLDESSRRHNQPRQDHEAGSTLPSW